MAGLRNRTQNALRYLKRHVPNLAADANRGTRDPVRAAAPAQVRLRCTNPQPCGQPTFRAAERIRCPKCCWPTTELGPVPAQGERHAARG